jgi:exodeoxyribonuclease VII small subunit
MAELKFEDGLKKLEKIVDDLEAGDIPLDEALEKYEEGIKLSRMCAKRLELAKKKVEILLKSDDGTVELKPFDEKDAEEKPSQGSGKKKKQKASGEEGLF